MTAKQPVKIKAWDHIAIAVHSVAEALPWFERVFGARKLSDLVEEPEGYRWITLGIGESQLELIEPVGESGFVTRFLAERGETFHHITLLVDDADEAAEALKANGVEPWGGVRGVPGWRETFAHPRDAFGVLFQFAQSDPETYNSWLAEGRPSS